jgi:peptide deformylase
MPTLKILIFPDPRLRTVATTVDTVDEGTKTLIKDMLKTMYEGNGIGLAATQVNIHKRIIVIDVSEEKNKPLILINPLLEEIIEPKKLPYSEGCLSVPGFYEELERPSKVRIKALGLDNKAFSMEAEGILSVVIQHEIDHLDGKIFVDYLTNLKREIIRKKLLKQKKLGSVSR